MAGGFVVTVIGVRGSNGNFTGEGYIEVPYLGTTKLKVVFNNIQNNSEKELIAGVVETTYDPKESAVYEVNVIKSVGDLLKDLLAILSKENPTAEDQKQFEKLGKQLEFYQDNLDKINMTEEDRKKFESLKGSLFTASISEMTDEQKKQTIETAKEAQNLYEKYKDEFEKVKNKESKVLELGKEFILNKEANFISPSGELVLLKEGTKVSFLCNEPNLNGYNGVLYDFETKDGKRWVSDIAIALNELNSSSATFKGYFQVSQESTSWAKDSKGNRILYSQNISNLKTGGQDIYFVHGTRNGKKIIYTILKQSVNVTTDWLPKNKTFSGSKYKKRKYNTSVGVLETIISTGCKSTPQEEKEILLDIIKKDGYTLTIYKNKTTKQMEIGEMAGIEIKAMVNVGIPEDIATGWVVKGLEDLQTKGINKQKA